MTQQEIFDHIYICLEKQNWEQSTKVVDFHAYCQYRGVNGRKCAVGHLINDEDYKDTYDDVYTHAGTISDLFHDKVLKLNNEIIPDTDEMRCFLRKLQKYHDSNIRMKEAFRRHAELHNLIIPYQPQ